MDLKKNAQSLSFIIYGLFALSLLILYNGFSTLYGNFLADFIIGEKQSVLIFNNLSYGNAATLLLIGSLVFFGMRYLTSRLESKAIIQPSNFIRFWILGGIILVASLLAFVDLFTIISGVLTGKSDTINLAVTFVTLLTVLTIILFCISEIRRKDNLQFLSTPFSIFLSFCIFSFLVGFFIAPPWTGRDAHKDQQQLQRLENIQRSFEESYNTDKDIPNKLEDIHSSRITERQDILDGVTNEPYSYKKLSRSSYKLCAQFLTSYDVYKRYKLYPAKFTDKPQEKGQTCYTVNLSLGRSTDYSDSSAGHD